MTEQCDVSRGLQVVRNPAALAYFFLNIKAMYEIELNNVPVKIWAKGVDPHAMKEIVNLSTLPFIFHHLAFMPDVHGGKGMPIGGVLATKGGGDS